MSSRHYNRQRQRNGSTLTSSLFKVSTTAAALYGTYQLASWAYNAWTQSNTKSHDDNDDDNEDDSLQKENANNNNNDNCNDNGTRLQLQSRLQSRRFPNAHERSRRRTKCRQESLSAMTDFLFTLQSSIETHTDCSKDTKQLKQLRKRKKQLHNSNSSNHKNDDNSVHNNVNVNVNVDCREEWHELERQEQTLWDKVKLESMTRLLATMYAHSLLFLVLTVQVHLLGRRLYDDSNDHNRNNQSHASHAIVLQKTYTYFFQQGIPNLCQSLRHILATKQEFAQSCWDMTHVDGITLSQFLDGIHTVRFFMEDLVSSSSLTSSKFQYNGNGNKNGNTFIKNSDYYKKQSKRESSQEESKEEEDEDAIHKLLDEQIPLLVSFLIPPESDPSHNHNDDPIQEAHYILHQTWDIVESPIFYQALKECLEHSFHQCQSHYWEGLFPSTSESTSQSEPTTPLHTNAPTSTSASTWKQNSSTSAPVPLVQIMTQLKHSTASFYKLSQHPNQTTMTSNHNNNNNTKDDIFSWDNPFLLPTTTTHTTIPYPNKYISTLESLQTVLDLGDVCFAF